MMKKKILFVCRANHFRSTVAEKILKNYRNDLIVKSAGLEVEKVHRTSAKASKNAAKYGINIRWHRCNQLDAKMVKYFDKIYVFENSHKKFIEKKFPESRGKVKVFYNHEDLKGKSPEAHMKVVRSLKPILKKLSGEI